MRSNYILKEQKYSNPEDFINAESIYQNFKYKVFSYSKEGQWVTDYEEDVIPDGKVLKIYDKDDFQFYLTTGRSKEYATGFGVDVYKRKLKFSFVYKGKQWYLVSDRAHELDTQQINQLNKEFLCKIGVALNFLFEQEKEIRNEMRWGPQSVYPQLPRKSSHEMQNFQNLIKIGEKENKVLQLFTKNTLQKLLKKFLQKMR